MVSETWFCLGRTRENQIRTHDKSMATNLELIYCGGGNRRFFEIATKTGFLYGSQLPETVYGPLHFADQDWKKPNLQKYLTELNKHRPFMASVLDLEKPEQLTEVLNWSEDVAPFVEEIMIIPKCFGVIAHLPRRIGGKNVRLGYSVPTKFGGTPVPVWEFCNWPVHLLGGSPQSQMKLFHYFHVVSVDGNMAQLMATRHCAFWVKNSKRYKSGHWPTLKMADGEKMSNDAPYEAFRRSCENIMQAWSSVTNRSK